MRQRLTFIVAEGTHIDAKSIVISGGSLNYTSYAAAAAIEQRTTLNLFDLPKQLRVALQDSHELHIRWVKAISTKSTIPLVSRVPSGLHVFYTPQDGKRTEHLCRMVKLFFGDNLKCDSLSETFSRPPILSERFAYAATYQYHQQLSDLVRPVARLIKELCPAATDIGHDTCRQKLATHLTATQVDVDYDVVSHALVITAQWAQMPGSQGISAARLLSKVDASEGTVEVGILAPEKGGEPEELKMSGFLTVVGEDKEPSPVLFSFPSRHHPLSDLDITTFKSTFDEPTGLHPTLHVTLLGETLHPPRDTCALHTYLTLPSGLFIDRYQLSDPILLAAKNLRALHALSGADDLEAPDWAVKQWGSAALLELVTPDALYQDKAWQIEIPMHLRYMQTENTTVDTTMRHLEIPRPIVFWACEAEDGLKMSTNPFDRVNLGYDGLFGPKTMFYHVPASGRSLPLDVAVPVINPSTAAWVPTATFLVVLAGIGWVLWSLLEPLTTKSQIHAKEE